MRSVKLFTYTVNHQESGYIENDNWNEYHCYTELDYPWFEYQLVAFLAICKLIRCYWKKTHMELCNKIYPEIKDCFHKWPEKRNLHIFLTVSLKKPLNNQLPVIWEAMTLTWRQRYDKFQSDTKLISRAAKKSNVFMMW